MGEDRAIRGQLEVSHLQGLVDPEPGDVRLNRGRDVLREGLELQVPDVMLDHAAFLDAARLSHQMDGDLDLDLLVPSDPQEVDVDESSQEMVALDLARHRQEVLAVHPKVDQDVCPGVGVQHVEKVARTDADGERFDAVAVDDRGDAPLRPNLSGHALAGAVAPIGLQLLFHRLPLRVPPVDARRTIIETSGIEIVSAGARPGPSASGAG